MLGKQSAEKKELTTQEKQINIYLYLSCRPGLKFIELHNDEEWRLSFDISWGKCFKFF